MKHAGPKTLECLGDLLAELRKIETLREPRPGTFYVRSKAFLHFHEDAAGIFADVKLDFATFTRCEVTTGGQQRALLKKMQRCLREL